jgi:hypothetical protein
MPRFFIHVPDGDALRDDAEGAEFPSLEVARAQALAAARDRVVDELLSAHRVPDGEVRSPGRSRTGTRYGCVSRCFEDLNSCHVRLGNFCGCSSFCALCGAAYRLRFGAALGAQATDNPGCRAVCLSWTFPP